MPALFFPNADVLRLALASGLVPGSGALWPGRAGFDRNDRLWLEPDETPREAVAALVRLGVVALGSPGVPTVPVRSWAELLPLRPSADTTGTVLFDMPDRALTRFVARVRDAGGPVGVRLLPEPYLGRAWVTATAPPASVFLRADVEAYHERAPGVWVARGWQHPLHELLAVPDGEVLLCDPECGVRTITGPVPSTVHGELSLRPRSVPPQPTAPAPKVGASFRLVRDEHARSESLWVLSAAEATQLEHVARTADERLLRKFEVATVHAGKESRVLVRRAEPNNDPAILPISVPGFRPHPLLHTLFVPSGRSLRPVIRVHELANELGVSPGRVVWVEEYQGSIEVHSAATGAFRSLADQVEYTTPQPVALRPLTLPDETFPFARFALLTEPTVAIEIDLELEPQPPVEVLAPAKPPAEPAPSWVSKSVSRVLKWVRRPRELAAAPKAAPRPDPPDRVERKLSSPDALLIGPARIARRHELETRLLADLPRLGADARAARWAELAGVYGATGQALDAAVCWTNGLWECATPPAAWLEQWVVAECRAAKKTGWGTDLERWLSEPGRPGTGRVVAALAAHFGGQPSPTAEFLSALPRVLALLENHFDDIPVRAAWLARLAIARSCDGDVLGVARWRDRLIRRLRDRGPGLDLDEPSFLRFRGTATRERFRTAGDLLGRVCEPVRGWVERHAGTRGLQMVGLDCEEHATKAYAQLLLAWGLGALGERTKSRDAAAFARKELSTAAGPGADPAAHALLGDLFLHRIRDAQEGHAPKSHLPPDLQERLDKLPMLARYSVNRLREHCRVLQPVGAVNAYGGLNLREFWGADRLGERLSVLGTRTEPEQLNDETRALLALMTEEPNTATVPRITLALLEVAAGLDSALLEELLTFVPPALDWTEARLRAGRWTDAERPNRVARFQSRMVDLAFSVADAPAADRLLKYLARGADKGPLRSAALASAPRVFRAARRFNLNSDAEALIQVLDPTRGEWSGEPVTAERVGLASGWYVAGDSDAGLRVLNAASSVLFDDPKGLAPKPISVAIAYAEALGFAPAKIAPGRLAELFQQLPRVTTSASSNCYFTLHLLRLIDALVRSVVTDEFTIGAAVRGWLDEDEFVIRRRIHRDMAALLRDGGLG